MHGNLVGVSTKSTNLNPGSEVIWKWDVRSKRMVRCDRGRGRMQVLLDSQRSTAHQDRMNIYFLGGSNQKMSAQDL